ncbi:MULTISPECIES: glycosyltransferase family protein [Acinetobacter]|uniref:hypothetical protein n=1 Tax=Acinetobacter TaxID=469 RepID=UPI000EA00B88|nr:MULTISPECIES: hypothetical protein [Acinetobacter]RKG42757.1 hypothetical protein D7V51_10955 [Acinetobacter cumulans]RZG58610.1 hypothetical protein EXE29_10180 [Acinetobacter sp. WCHAc060006]
MEKNIKKNILICSGFTETELYSFRENVYPNLITKNKNWNVTIYTSNQSWIWKYNRAKKKQTIPYRFDDVIQQNKQVKIIRKKPIIRLSDFLIMPIPFKLIRNSDLVHIIEFRQGLGVFIALFAKLMGKPVIYDHEQRGDRHYTILHSLDSLMRRFFIRMGSLFVDHVRHTVIENKKHFLKNSFRKKISMSLAPLGADPNKFFYYQKIRDEKRKIWGISETDILVVISGKIDKAKRTMEAISALLDNGIKVKVVGSYSIDIEYEMNSLMKRGVSFLPQASADELNQIYNAADAVLFTTFSVSYWEALATGAKIIIPKTEFSDLYISENLKITFGNEEMFSVVEEQYKESADVYNAVKSATKNISELRSLERKAETKYTWENTRKQLIEDYSRFI